MDHSSIIKILVVSAIMFYAFSSIMAFMNKKKTGLAFFISGWLVNLAIFVLNWINAGEPPFGNMYHVLIVISLCFLPAFMLLKRRDGLDWLLGYFSITSVMPLLGSLFMKTELSWQRMPALQSAWFVPHVAAYVLSYSLDAVGFILSVIFSFQVFVLKKHELKHDYEEAIYKVLLTAFPLMTFGMLSGALWADDAWGRYWSWDVKESWALITWILYLVYFHCRKASELKRWALLAQCFAFLALIITFLAVNFSLIPSLKSMLHAYM
ncbi:MAG: cytochrome c biogenesis protein CcsA [Victivallaceae bacterium]